MEVNFMTEPESAVAENKTNEVKFGVVGCGRMGATNDENAKNWAIASEWLPLSHASAIVAVDRTRLIAVCDVNSDAAARAGELYDVPHYVDYREMLAGEDLQALSIATRTQERKEIIEAAVGAGVRGIYCEKPLCNTLEDADGLAVLLKSKNVAFAYGTRRRFMSVYNQVRDSVNAGEIGELKTIVIKFGHSMLFWGHPHSVDIASFFANDAAVKYVQADLSIQPSAISETDGVTTIDDDPKVNWAIIEFENGVVAHIVAGLSFDVELLGSDGTVSVRSDGTSVQWRKNATDVQDDCWLTDEKIIKSNSNSSGTVNTVEALSNAVTRGEYPGYDIDMAVKNQEILFGFVYSQLFEGRRISFPLKRDGLKITGRFGNFFA